MNSKVISFQIVQGYTGSNRSWTPDVIALCEDGSLWITSLSEYKYGLGNWKRMTSEPQQTEYNLYDNGNGQL